jgi:hypothetical protein
MNVLAKIKSLLSSAEAWIEAEFQKAQPWLKAFLQEVEHDAVTEIMPIVETAGAQVAAEIVSGQPVAAVGTTIAAIALQAAKNAEKAGVNVATHDMSAAITGYLANLKATGVAATAAQTATTAQANAA